ncbi:MAG TPA: YihY/virulence factor BrkB family protein [Steroidobacteraceae bacterium]|jgi:membrane protein|nr:YihY/virulence factor BrkB family protein [Steroidobacteraceae bacterium]
MGARRSLWTILKGTTDNWLEDQASSISAALAFYCAFSLAPLLIISVTFAGWIVGGELAYSYLGNQITLLLGKQSADLILQAMASSQSAKGVWATAISVLMLLVGASTVFSALQSALHQIWGGRAAIPTGWRAFLRTRLLTFGFILAIGFLLLVSLTLTTALTALRGYALRHFEGMVGLFAGIDFLLSIGLGTCMVAMMYRYLPAKRLPWRQVLIGALVTALLFHLGRWAIGLYLGHATQPTAYGAAASFAALLLWLYYTAQIFLFGAEFTACLGRTRKPPPLVSPSPSPSPGPAATSS